MHMGHAQSPLRCTSLNMSSSHYCMTVGYLCWWTGLYIFHLWQYTTCNITIPETQNTVYCLTTIPAYCYYIFNIFEFISEEYLSFCTLWSHPLLCDWIFFLFSTSLLNLYMHLKFDQSILLNNLSTRQCS